MDPVGAARRALIVGLLPLAGCFTLVTESEMAGEWCALEEGSVDRFVFEGAGYQRFSDQAGSTPVESGTIAIEKRQGDNWLVGTPEGGDTDGGFEHEIVVVGCQFLALRLEQDPDDENHVDRTYGRVAGEDFSCFGSGNGGTKLRCRYYYGGIQDPPGCYDAAGPFEDLTPQHAECEKWYPQAGSAQ